VADRERAPDALQERLVSPGASVERATQWLQELVTELSGLRNATSRDPGFKNWRQNAITNLQRIWPVDQDHAERLRRIPFSPVDPRADVRAQRESFSRGCQEAARVLNSFIEEIHTQGVPDAPRDGAQATEVSEFVDDFPTVDLPRGDLSDTSGTPPPPSAAFEQLPSQGTDPSFLPLPRLHIDTHPSGTVLPKHHSTPPSEERPRRKGLGVAAKLRDLLGLSGFGEKPASPPSGNSSALPQLPPRSLDIVPVGDEVEATPRQAAWPMPQPKVQAPGAPPAPPASPLASTGAAAGQAPEPPQPAQAANVPPAETGMSVVMSRPTTLRGNIGKVSIESLISPEFRGGGERSGATPEAPESPAAETPAAPQVSPAEATPTTGRPPLSIVPPLSTDPEFNVDPAPPATEPAASATEPAPSQTEPAAEPSAATARPSKVLPLPLSRGARARNKVPDAAEPGTEPETDGEPSEPMTRADSAALSRATADFMRTSPVLGATGRKVQRAPQESPEHGFVDPDAIAIVSMFEELDDLGVPKTRQSDAHARLLDLARRIEADDLKWAALRKAVWFAMEYPEVARRLMPLLLPWIDRTP